MDARTMSPVDAAMKGLGVLRDGEGSSNVQLMPPGKRKPWLPPLWLWPLFGAIQIGLAVFYLLNEMPILIVSAVSLLGLAVLNQVATVRRRRERNVIPEPAEAGG